MKKELKDCFDKDGEFIIPGFDPFRMKTDDPAEQELYESLFDENGYLNDRKGMADLIAKNKWDPWCNAVKCYYASVCIDSGCGGNYTAIYAWR